MIKIRNLLVRLSFIGTNYHGFQIQKNAVTVQQVFQNALSQVLGYLPDIKGCSRTDTGVHAYEYALSTKIDDDISENKLQVALNALLPDDIVVLSICGVEEDFHARYSCVAKRYRYVIYNNEVMDPFLVGRALQVKKKIDIGLLNEAAARFVGTHEFIALSATKGDLEDTIRTVYNAGITQDKNIVTFMVTADGFLYKMVRIMVGVLLAINNGKLSIDDIDRMLETGIRTKGSSTASPNGLYLDKVFYDLGEIDEQYSR